MPDNWLLLRASTFYDKVQVLFMFSCNGVDPFLLRSSPPSIGQICFAVRHKYVSFFIGRGMHSQHVVLVALIWELEAQRASFG